MGFWHKAALGLLVTVGGLTLFGLYLGRKRRKDSARQLKQIRGKEEKKTEVDSKLVRLKDFERFRDLFTKEVELGSLFLDKGLYEGAILHYVTALEMCEDPQQVMDTLKQALPPRVFRLLQNYRARVGSILSRAN